MSRIGKKPINIPEGVEVKLDGKNLAVKGKLGELFLEIDTSSIKLSTDDGKVVLTPLSVLKEVRSKFGLYRSLINNMIIGVTEGFEKTLKIVGVGYRASLKGSDIELLVGYSNPVLIEKVEGVTFGVPNNTTMVIKGIDKQLIGQVAAKIRAIREPEPYKGKGIMYSNEIIRRKVGKAAASSK